jgi:hypothetical protein
LGWHDADFEFALTPRIELVGEVSSAAGDMQSSEDDPNVIVRVDSRAVDETDCRPLAGKRFFRVVGQASRPIVRRSRFNEVAPLLIEYVKEEWLWDCMFPRHGDRQAGLILGHGETLGRRADAKEVK